MQASKQKNTLDGESRVPQGTSRGQVDANVSCANGVEGLDQRGFLPAQRHTSAMTQYYDSHALFSGGVVGKAAFEPVGQASPVDLSAARFLASDM